MEISIILSWENDYGDLCGDIFSTRKNYIDCSLDVVWLYGGVKIAEIYWISYHTEMISFFVLFQIAEYSFFSLNYYFCLLRTFEHDFFYKNK